LNISHRAKREEGKSGGTLQSKPTVRYSYFAHVRTGTELNVSTTERRVSSALSDYRVQMLWHAQLLILSIYLSDEFFGIAHAP
jgi:hypothetical protein